MSRLEELLRQAQNHLDEHQDPDAALERAQSAMIIDAANPDVWLLMGEAYCRKGQLQDALGCFESAMKYSRTSTETIQVKRADMYAQTGHMAEAIKEYQDVLSTNPSSIPARTGLASCLLHTGHLDLAQQEFETAIKESNGACWFRRDVERCYHGLSRALWRKGLRLEAIRVSIKGFFVSIFYPVSDSYFP